MSHRQELFMSGVKWKIAAIRDSVCNNAESEAPHVAAVERDCPGQSEGH